MQKFFEKTIESDFIKSLLYYTPISQYECVQDGDYLIGDEYTTVEDREVQTVYGERYIYNGCIIKCTKSGTIGLSKVQKPLFNEDGEEYTDETWQNYVEENEAEYEILKDYNFAQYDYKTTPIFHSTTSYYDSRTHYALGKFLRAYRGMTGIDLMPYYNCYGYETVGGLYIGEKRIIEQNNPNKVICSVPICWNRRYLIHIDKLSGIALKAVLADDEGGLLKSSALPVIVESNGSTEPIFTGGRTFNDPIEYQVLIQNQSDKNLMYGNRNNLRLLIQVNKGAESSLAVIETDSNFTSMMSKQPTRKNKSHTSITINAESFVTATEKEQNESCFSQSKLTLMNTGEQYAYTDTLIQYLLKNVICKDDDISNNVGRVQKAVGHEVTDQWSDNLRVKLFNAQMEKGLGRLDIDGNVTKNVESMLRKEFSYKDYTLGE